MKILCFLLAFISTHTFASNSLTLYILPPYKDFNWESPKNVIRSVVKNSFFLNKRFMGHMFIELQCDDKQELLAMSSKNFNYITQLLFQSRGLGILFHSFEGEIEDKEDLSDEIDDYLSDNEVNFIKFLINQGHCKRLQLFLKEFKDYKIEKNYGLAHRPLFAEGAGSTAFATSFLEVAGLMEQEFRDNWMNYINIPPDLAGPPLQDKQINFFSLVSTNLAWTKENKKHFKLVFWDPDKIYKWVHKKINQPSLPQGHKKIHLKKASGLEIDKTAWPAPLGQIWRQGSYTRTNLKTKDQGPTPRP